MHRAASGAQPGREAERARRTAVGRVVLVVSLVAGLLAVLPAASADDEQRIDASATTVPSDAPPSTIAAAPGDGDEPTAPPASVTTLAPVTAALMEAPDPSTTTTVDQLPVGVTPELVAAMTEAVSLAQELAAAEDEEAVPFVARPIRNLLDDAPTTTVQPLPPPILVAGGDTTTTTRGTGGTTATTRASPGSSTSSTAPRGSGTSGPGSGPGPGPGTGPSSTATTRATTSTTRAATSTTSTTRATTTTTRPTTTTVAPLREISGCSSPPRTTSVVPWATTAFVFDGQSNTSQVPAGGSRYPDLFMRERFPQVRRLVATNHPNQPRLLPPNLPQRGYIVVAVPGTTQSDRTGWAGAQNWTDSYARIPDTPSILFNEGGSTDFLREATAEEMAQRTIDYVQGRRAAGFDVIVQASTLPAELFNRAREAERREYHDLLCRNYRSWGIDILIDVQDVPELRAPADGQWDERYWLNEPELGHIHLSAEGHRLLADHYLRILQP